MKLKNDFDREEIVRLWDFQNWCEVCKSNEMVSYHHIRGRTSSSVMNSIPLCITCHKEADGHNVSDKEFQDKLLKYTKKRADILGYKLKEKDKDFLNDTKRN